MDTVETAGNAGDVGSIEPAGGDVSSIEPADGDDTQSVEAADAAGTLEGDAPPAPVALPTPAVTQNQREARLLYAIFCTGRPVGTQLHGCAPTLYMDANIYC